MLNLVYNDGYLFITHWGFLLAFWHQNWDLLFWFVVISSRFILSNMYKPWFKWNIYCPQEWEAAALRIHLAFASSIFIITKLFSWVEADFAAGFGCCNPESHSHSHSAAFWCFGHEETPGAPLPCVLGQLQLQLWMIPHFPSLNQLLLSVLKVLWSWIRTSWGSGKWETPTWTMLGQGHSAMKTQMFLPKSREICWVRQGFGVGMVWTSTEMSPPSLCLHQVTPGPSQLTLEVLLHHKSEQSTSLPSVLQNGV